MATRISPWRRLLYLRQPLFSLSENPIFHVSYFRIISSFSPHFSAPIYSNYHSRSHPCTEISHGCSSLARSNTATYLPNPYGYTPARELTRPYNPYNPCCPYTSHGCIIPYGSTLFFNGSTADAESIRTAASPPASPSEYVQNSTESRVRSSSSLFFARRLSSYRGTAQGGSQWNTSMARAVDFQISNDEAVKAHEAAVYDHWLGPLKTERQKVQVQATWQPFWAFEASFEIIFRGQVGFQQMKLAYDPRVRQYLPTMQTVWRSSDWMRMSLHLLPTDTEVLQYASVRYSEDFMQNFSGEMIARARPFTREMLRGRSLEPFIISRETAWVTCRQKLMARKVRLQASEALRQAYGADRVHGLEIQVVEEEVVAQAVYLPSYIVEASHQLWKFQAVVNGFNGEVHGDRLFSEMKAAVATLSLTTASFLFLPPLLGLPPSIPGIAWFASQAFLTGFSYLFARWFPRVQMLRREISQAEHVARAVVNGSANLEGQEEWVHRIWENVFARTGALGGMEQTFRDFFRQREQRANSQTQQQWQWEWQSGRSTREKMDEETQYERTQRENFQRRYSEEQSRRQRMGGDGSRDSRTPLDDPKGHYKALGLSRSATANEIKAAYRRLAFETHPDRVADPKKKSSAEEQFKRISEAYSVLGNDSSRANYDRGVL